MWHFDGCLRLTTSRLALDSRRREAWGYVSHAHADHMARHARAIATPATAALYRHRLGGNLEVREIDYAEPIDFGDSQITLHPAGHCLGSSMIRVDNGNASMLYTGDFKLGSSLTAAEAKVPTADTLIMETTFGSPKYRLPPREKVSEQLIEAVRVAWSNNQVPVIHAYALGKSQEVSAILTSAGIPVLQHPTIYAITEVYRQLGIDFRGPQHVDVAEYAGRPLAEHAVVTLPKSMSGFRLAGLGDTYSIAVSGWAMDTNTKYRWDVDLALPLSDHADFDELLEIVERVSPRKVFCTHGPSGFAEHLCERGVDAEPLVSESQQRLF